jgi:MFS transporter, PAT family, beta-lactamase induction signal transducer AmpG
VRAAVADTGLRAYLHRRVLAMLFLGFSAGIPLLLVFSTLTAWLRDAGVERTTIGFFGWIGITFSIKVLWAPVVDRLGLPLLTDGLGQRRGWMLLAQVACGIGIAAMAVTDPITQTVQLALIGLLVAFASATQDIAVDAWRIEAAEPERQGAMAASYMFGYRIALLVTGAGVLFIADFADWRTGYLSMAVLMGVGVVTTLIIPEPDRRVSAATEAMEQALADALARYAHLPGPLQRIAAWFSGAVAGPFVDFFQRNGVMAVSILALVGLYKLSDIAMGVMANPFYIDLGFSLSEIASVAKVYGFGMTLLGTAVGGYMVARIGIMRTMLIGAIMVASTNLLFAVLARMGAELWMLAVTISGDNLSVGISAVALIAYASSLTNRAYTATQYALFSSLMTLPGKMIAGFSGVVVDQTSYEFFFIYAAVLGIPAILLVMYLMKRQPEIPIGFQRALGLDEVESPGALMFTTDGPPSIHGFVVQDASGIYAYKNICPHQARALNWSPSGFLTRDRSQIMCSAHGAVFEIATGRCVDGPCVGAGLRPLEVLVVDGSVFVREP